MVQRQLLSGFHLQRQSMTQPLNFREENDKRKHLPELRVHEDVAKALGLPLAVP